MTATLDKLTEREFAVFADGVSIVRSEALVQNESFLDTSLVWFPMFKPLMKLVKDAKSVTEYGGDFPVLSLYLLNEGRIDFLKVLTSDESVLRHLHYVKSSSGLNIEPVYADLKTVGLVPIGGETPTDVGVSFNGVYDSVDRPVIQESCHTAFGVFRYAPVPRVVDRTVEKWAQRAHVIAQMSRFSEVEAGFKIRKAEVPGYSYLDTQERVVTPKVEVELQYVIGRE